MPGSPGSSYSGEIDAVERARQARLGLLPAEADFSNMRVFSAAGRKALLEPPKPVANDPLANLSYASYTSSIRSATATRDRLRASQRGSSSMLSSAAAEDAERRRNKSRADAERQATKHADQLARTMKRHAEQRQQQESEIEELSQSLAHDIQVEEVGFVRDIGQFLQARRRRRPAPRPLPSPLVLFSHQRGQRHRGSWRIEGWASPL